ncbi:MAG: hypothetical protein EOP09_10095, partial [Proteobacteria bacterium]
GTYSGMNIERLDGSPAISIETSEPIIIENCNVRGTGDLIRSWANGANITIRNCNGYGVKVPAGVEQGKFLSIVNPGKLLVHNNYFQDVAKGLLVYIAPDYAQNHTVESVRVFANIGRNMNDNTQEFGTFVQFNRVLKIPQAEIAWNQFINEPGKNMSSDNINMFNSSGTPSNPIRIHHNFTQGAYPTDPVAGNYTGSGLTSDGWGDANVPWEVIIVSHIEAYENTLLSTGNAAMNIAGGHDIRYHHNRIVSSGVLPDGSGRKFSTYAGASAFNYFNHPSTLYYNTVVDQNVIGFMRYGNSRQDLFEGCDSTRCFNNTALPDPITTDTERQEWALWNVKLAQALQDGSVPNEVKSLGYIGSSTHANVGTDRSGFAVSPFPGFEDAARPTLPAPPSSQSVVFASDTQFQTISNGWGDVERDRSNGEQGAHDGNPLKINGVSYTKGLGGHANFEVRVPVPAGCSRFAASDGVDDEVGNQGNVTFRVVADSEELFRSSALTGAAAAESFSINVGTASSITLFIDNNGDGTADHGDWADA